MSQNIVIDSPIGKIQIIGTDKGIESISLHVDQAISKTTPSCLEACVNQIKEYFECTRKDFNLRFNLKGTDFQMQVWEALQSINYGETVSYQDIAFKINNPKAVQAVGSAIGKNPCALVIPCHRVINKSGGIGGFAAGLDIKRWLLKHETSI